MNADKANEPQSPHTYVLYLYSAGKKFVKGQKLHCHDNTNILLFDIASGI